MLLFGVVGDLVVRVSTRLLVVAWTVAASLGGAAAQPYPSPPLRYDGAPVPPLDVGPPAAQPPYEPYDEADPAYDDQAGENPPHFYPSTERSHSGTVDRADALRPPADIGGPAADVTGSVRYPADAAGGPAPDRAKAIAALPPEDQPETGPAKELPPRFHRQLVDYVTSEPAGTVIIDTPHTYLYLVLGGGKALRYGIGVGREGFTWSGGERISRMSEWPDWHPPKEMIERQPYLPRFMAGGEGNPLGARALYLGNTLYRIHGTNQPSTIGHFVSSGCIRLTNEDVEDLYGRVNLGTRVVVLPGPSSSSASASTYGAVAR